MVTRFDYDAKGLSISTVLPSPHQVLCPGGEPLMFSSIQLAGELVLITFSESRREQRRDLAVLVTLSVALLNGSQHTVLSKLLVNSLNLRKDFFNPSQSRNKLLFM